MRHPFFLITLLGALAFTPALAGCELLLGETKMSKGQLYQCGDGRYDTYFDAVHREQLASGNWGDEAKQSRKPIVTALSLKPDASNGTILTATRELKTGSAALSVPVEQTTGTETERARHMHAEAKRLEDMKEQGKDLKKQAGEDKENMGAQKADDKAVAKKDEVKRELGASIDALDKMANDARRASREAEELADKLTAAWTGRPEDEKSIKIDDKAPDKGGDKADKADKADKKKPDAPAPAKKPVAKPAGPATAKPVVPVAPVAPADPPPPKPAPTAKPPDEVFNP